MGRETLAIRLPAGMELRTWFAERTIDPPPTAAQREAMEAVASALVLRGANAERVDHEDTIELRFEDCVITVAAEGARIVRPPRGMLGLGRSADWYAQTLMVEHGMVLYDEAARLALPPPGVDVGPEPYRPRPRRGLFRRS